MDIGIAGKVVVVTGASRGIGREICAGFAGNGAIVVGVDILDMSETGEYLSSLETPDSFQWHAFEMDLSSPESVQAGCQKIQAQFPEVHVLVNNAALYGGLKMTPMEKQDLAEWDKVYQINVRGTYLMIRELLPALKLTKGKVVNFASGSALRGSPFLLHYVASKGAVMGMTRTLATELGMYGINVNAVTPGLIDTPSSQGLGEKYAQILQGTVQSQSIKEPMQASDVVGSVLFLSSAWSDGVTGQQVLADRGLNKL